MTEYILKTGCAELAVFDDFEPCDRCRFESKPWACHYHRANTRRVLCRREVPV